MSAGIDELIERLRNNEIGLRYISANEIMSEAAGTIERLQRELDEARKDAERYRDLFTITNFCRDPLWPVVEWMRGNDVTKEEVDAALDAARQPQG